MSKISEYIILKVGVELRIVRFKNLNIHKSYSVENLKKKTFRQIKFIRNISSSKEMWKHRHLYKVENQPIKQGE